ncbi:MAG: DUF962 domain-containing protein [Myxococcota bacterium]|nr:DUF962 domain-containing protein [Myxococcota bacterium]MDW8363095.1 DUF962 domain-containing protein [Myxococcales bacterium]
MAWIRLGPQWSAMLRQYREDHSHPVNQACHAIGIPLIAASIPVGATVVGLPLAVAMFGVGWAFQFAGHLAEGKKPSFFEDRRYLLVGLLWWSHKVGLDIFEVTEEPAAPPSRHAEDRRTAETNTRDVEP